ncbi:unnamed protein product [Miscanthus lutarioriparius]|uniref:Glutaredoxin domain-containing protein n=1 Tax=Miscanthus lutarioriparius TaxID=422564 RepID=A0A811Q0Y6_9POAL|nr:unnamed protein product [Miscanthus lutarioriparius]
MAMDHVARLASERAVVVVFTASNCSMGDVVTSLLSSLGVNAAVHDLDRDPQGLEMQRELARRLGADAGRGTPPCQRCSWATTSSAGQTGSWRCTSPASSCPCSGTPARSGCRS